MITLEIKYSVERDYYEEDFEFDDTKYWVGQNNFFNVVSDYLNSKYRGKNIQIHSANPKIKTTK